MMGPGIFGSGVRPSSGSMSGASSGWASAAAAETAARGARRDVDYLEDRLERLSLVCMAMWSLLQDKTKLTERDLQERVEMLDLMDGRADGKATRTVRHCHACKRPLNPKHRRCLYCGEPVRSTSAFDAV